MRIQHLKIHNYRSIRDLEMECGPLVTMVGPTNNGKSNIFSAIEFFLSTSAKPGEKDFFANRDEGDNELWVEITFNELTDQEKNTFKKYVQSDGTVCIRKTARLQDGKVEIIYNGYVEEPDIEWLRSENTGNYTSREKIERTPLKDLVPPSGRLTKRMIEEAQQRYIEQHREELSFSRTLETAPLLGQRNVGGGVLPEFYLIPAVRDLTEEIKVKTTSTFGRLLTRAIREMAERGANQLAILEKLIEEELKAWSVKVSIEVTPPELERIFELGTDIQIDDGIKTTADRKGHGLQRAMIFALLRAWAKTLRQVKNTSNQQNLDPRRKSDSVVFAMEEPELFLHPHAQRKLAMTLREISQTPEHQVIICTHSTHFIDLDHYKEVVIVTKPSPEIGTVVHQCTEDLFSGEDASDRKKRFHMAYWINPDRGEMFFAKKVVFVEGETEKVVLPYLAKRLGVFDPDISIIDCGSKHNLPLYITIANAFKISYIVIHDEDPLPDPIPDNWNENKVREKRRTFELNEQIRDLVEPHLGKIEMFSPDFEGASGVPKSQSKKKGKALAALDHLDQMEISEIPNRLKQVVYSVYKKAQEEGENA